MTPDPERLKAIEARLSAVNIGRGEKDDLRWLLGQLATLQAERDEARKERDEARETAAWSGEMQEYLERAQSQRSAAVNALVECQRQLAEAQKEREG